MNKDKVEVKETKDQPGKVSTCFEGAPFAELMQKVMGERGIGSLCQEMMRTLMNGDHDAKDSPQEPREESHGKGK